MIVRCILFFIRVAAMNGYYLGNQIQLIFAVFLTHTRVSVVLLALWASSDVASLV